MKTRLSLKITPGIAVVVGLFVTASFLMFYKLGSLVPGLAASEQQLPGVVQILKNIWHNPMELPWQLSQLLVSAILPSAGYTASRLPSALLGLAIICLSYWLLRQWYGKRLAAYGTLLLMSSPWLLHTARLATSEIVYPLAMVSLLCLAALWHQKDRSTWLIYLTTIAVLLSLYVPGVIWLLVSLFIIERRNIMHDYLKASRLVQAINGSLAIILLVPLIKWLVEDWHNLVNWLGWSGPLNQASQIPLNFVMTWVHIFIGWYSDPIHNLGQLAAVNLLITISFIVGLHLYRQHLAARAKLLAALWLIGTLLIALPGNISLSLLIPIVFVLATGGIGYLLHLWLKVFPRNPLARGFGIGIIALVVIAGVSYNLRAYYLAWANNPEVKRSFSRQIES